MYILSTSATSTDTINKKVDSNPKQTGLKTIYLNAFANPDLVFLRTELDLKPIIV